MKGLVNIKIIILPPRLSFGVRAAERQGAATGGHWAVTPAQCGHKLLEEEHSRVVKDSASTQAQLRSRHSCRVPSVARSGVLPPQQLRGLLIP